MFSYATSKLRNPAIGALNQLRITDRKHLGGFSIGVAHAFVAQPLAGQKGFSHCTGKNVCDRVAMARLHDQHDVGLVEYVAIQLASRVPLRVNSTLQQLLLHRSINRLADQGAKPGRGYAFIWKTGLEQALQRRATANIADADHEDVIEHRKQPA